MGDKVKRKYQLAKGWMRLLSKSIDLVFSFLFCVALFFLIFQKDQFPTTFVAWKFFLFTLLGFIYFNIYFVFIPYLSKGRTIGNKLMKLKLHWLDLVIENQSKKYQFLPFKFLVQLFLKESVLWFIPLLTFLILGIVGFIDAELVKDYLSKPLSNSINNPNVIYQVVQSVFSACFGFSLILNLLIIFNILMSSGRKSFHDHISKIVVLDLRNYLTSQSITDKKKHEFTNKENNINHLPGMFDPN